LKRLISLITTIAVLAALVAVITRQVARTHGRFRGLLYRLSGRQPDPDVDDLTLADRVRSELGPVEKQLDLPHIHVMVEDHVVLLHGDVQWPYEAATLVEAARDVSGVRDVESHLHTGMLSGDTRPSQGRLRDGHLAGAH
jgi:hypothetical protein